jgi:hypothetical protein
VPQGDRTELYMKYFDFEGKESYFSQVEVNYLSLKLFSSLEKESES